MFELHYEPFIISDSVRPWQISVIPWDTETFGFGVSVLNPCYEGDDSGGVVSLDKALKAYSISKQVEMVITTVSCSQKATTCLLQNAGFHFVDQSLRIQYRDLKDLPAGDLAGFSLSPAVSDDVKVIIEMAGRSFKHGRYHQDAEFPQSLADQRYRDWVRRCLEPENPQQLLAARFQNEICGFSIVECKGKEGYLHLHAIGSEWQGKKLGYRMIIESLRHLENMGVECVDTRISASNLKALNMHSRLAGRFVEADYLLHWNRSGMS